MGSKISRAAFAIAVLSWVILISGCRYSPPHPPSFVDFHRLGPGISEDENKLKAQVAVFEAAMFSPEDIESIRKTGGAHELLGAALLTRVGDRNIPALTHESFLQGSNDPVILTGIAKILVREIANDAQSNWGSTRLWRVLAALERIDTGNGLPLCVRAYAQLKEGDTNAARRSVATAIQRPLFRLRGAELRQCVARAAVAAKYPKFTASMLAIGTLGLSTEIAIVGKYLLEDPQLDRATAEDCLELGRRYEAQATLFIDQLIAFNLQKRALEFLKPPGFEKELQRMQDAKEKIRTAVAFLDSAEAHTASESQWLVYFEILFTKSELEAVKHLAAMLDHEL